MFPAVPFQPECAAPITPATGSTASTAPQSADSTPSASPGTRVTRPSPSGPRPRGQSGSAVRLTTSVEWVWVREISACAGR